MPKDPDGNVGPRRMLSVSGEGDSTPSLNPERARDRTPTQAPKDPVHIVSVVGAIAGLIAAFWHRTPSQSESTTRAYDAVVDRAVTVIGDQEQALRWMGTPVAALGYQTPVSLLGHP